ncbi:MAG: oligoribonuclease [Candidatus Bipolaricaulota bacterium]|nr:oligoribonuclease [Candidatus Bipolaricaulota bacterium]
MKKEPNNLVWLDLETSGIDVETKAILEVAMVITDKDLNVIAEGPELVIYQPDEVLENLDNWCKKQYRASGLIDEVRRSSVSLARAEDELVSFASQYCPPRACPLCGNAICFDRRFIIRYMPHLNTLLSYRNVDVSTIKELVGRWYPEVLAGIGNSQTSKHRALSDIHESIGELMHYRKNVFGRRT